MSATDKNAPVEPVVKASNMPGGYNCVLDAPEKGYPFLYVNDQFCRILGWTREEIAREFDDCFTNMLHPDDMEQGLKYHHDDASFDPESDDRVFRMRGKDGWRWVAGTANRVVVDGVPCVQGVISDIDRFMNAAQAASKAKTDFLFNMSHDIRTPMNAIVGFTDLLEQHLDDREAALGYLQKIKSSNAFLLSLINNVLEMARIESGQEHLDESPVNVGDFFAPMMPLFQEQMARKGVTLDWTIQVEHMDVFVDETKIREVLLNLLSNAEKYTPAGGRVTLTLTELPGQQEGTVLFKTVVEDTGIGMSAEFLECIFDEFSRERTSTESRVIGTGLGMPIVKRLVDLMHGTIQVESELGAGTKITLLVPHRVAESAPRRDGGQQGRTLEEFAGTRVLLAEDNDLNAEIALTFLGDAGLLVERVADGIACVDAVEHSDEGYDVILMDVQMPQMDGYKATQAIRRIPDRAKAGVPIVAMTANAFDEDRERALEMGMDAHVPKPIDLDVLAQALAQVLGR
ncbi:MAG: ATP-binding protein [Coriobacteriia bacterium]|nr:ATP-binding protein [Coriobacteriia bacterium]